MGEKRIPSIESDEQSSKMSSKQSIPEDGKSIYEDFCLRHPKVAETIFDKLDNKSLLKSRKVSKVLKTFLTDQTIILMRKIEKTIGNPDQFAKLWKPILKDSSADSLKQLELATNLFYSGYKISNDNLEDPVQLISKEDPRSNSITPLHVAAGTGKPSLWRTLNLNFVAGPTVFKKVNSVQPTDSGNSTLHYADISGNFDACQLIMGEIEDENLKADDEKTPPHFAAKEGDVNICEWVLAENDDSNPGESDCRTPVHDISKMLIEKVNSVQPKDGYGNSPLHYAAMHGNLETCRIIMEESEDKNPKNKEEKTPIHFAAENGHLNVCKIILDQVSDKNPTDSEGKTPLHAVALIGNDEIYEEIATRADDVNPPDNYGWTPLHSAAKEGHFAICEWILAETDDANPGDNAGRTPLHEAANSCYAKICELITEELWAEDRNPRDNLGNTPRELWEMASQEFQQKLFGDIDAADCHELNGGRFGGSDDSNGDSSDSNGDSDDSKEASEDEKVVDTNENSRSSDQTNETQPPSAKKATVECPVANADNEGFFQVLDNVSNNFLHFEHDNSNGKNCNDSFGTNVNANLEGTSFGSTKNFQAYLTKSCLENGNTTPPPPMTMFGEDANTVLDQLVRLPTKKELYSVGSMKGSEVQPPLIASDEALLGVSDDSSKDSNDSKEQTIEDEDVFLSNPPDIIIDKTFRQMLLPPPVSAMSDHLVELKTSKELLSPMKDSNDSKEQSSEDKDVENKNLQNEDKETPLHFAANESHLNICEWVLADTDETYDSWKGSNDSKDHINKNQPPHAKKARVESIVIADNKAIPQVDGRVSVSSYSSNENFQEILSGNPLENGNTTPPPIMTMFGEDTNDFSDQFVRFPTTKELNSDEPPCITSNEGWLDFSNESLKVSDDSKEETTEDEMVNDTDIDKIFSEMLMPPLVSAIQNEDQLVEFQTSKDSKEQGTEDKEVNDNDDNLKGSDDFQDQTNENYHPRAKKTKNESPVFAENKAIPQVVNISLPSSHFENDKNSGPDIYDSFGSIVHSNLEGGASGNSFCSNKDFQKFLFSNPLENEDPPLPTIPTLSKEANNLLDQLVKFENSKEFQSNESMKVSNDLEDQTNKSLSSRAKKAKVKPFVIAEGTNIFKFEELIHAGDSMKGSDDLNKQSIKEEDFNDADDKLKEYDDSQDQTNETHPPRAKIAKIEEVFSIRQKLEKITKSGEHQKALVLLEKLGRMDIDLRILKDTMIGFTVQALKKSSADEEIILKSKSLIKVNIVILPD